MARGRAAHHSHLRAVAALGKALSRRARSSCELCEATGTKLKVVEVAGGPDEPEADWALLLCQRCEDLLGGSGADPSELRFLETTMWSELRPAQIAAVRLLRALDAAWAREALEGLYLDPETEALL